MNWAKSRVKPGKSVKLSEISTHAGIKIADKEKLKEELNADVASISELQYKLYAENRQSLLIILQGMDSAGKDGTIRHIMSGVNPQGVMVHSFKHPSDLELDHDYLWRHAQKLPEKGQITLFNRSHYENVLISRVHPEILLAERLPEIDSVKKVTTDFWKKRYKQINNFEKNNILNGTQIVKFFLHISKQEQANRLIERIENPEKHWKFSSNDIAERKYWDNYQDAYQKAINHTSTKDAPWYIIPADDKTYAHLLIGKIILEKLKDMNPSFPSVSKEELALMQKAKSQLTKEQKR